MLALSIALAVAIVLAAYFWIQWTMTKEMLRAERIASTQVQQHLSNMLKQQHEAWAKDSHAWNVRLGEWRVRMSEIAAIISRRPAKRRWLAMCREIAVIAKGEM